HRRAPHPFPTRRSSELADPAPGGQLEFAPGRGGLGTGRLSAGQRHQPAAVLVGQAQRAEGSLAYAGEDPAWRGTAGRLAGYPDRSEEHTSELQSRETLV